MTIAEALRQEGEHKNAEMVAKRLLARGELSFENIADIAGLSMDEVKALQAANQ